MKQLTMWSVVLLAACAGGESGEPGAATGAPALSATASAASIDWSRVDSAFGRRGVLQADSQVYRFGMPRGDLHVTAAGVDLRPTFALGSWLAFKAHGDGAVAMGDLVLTEAELAPVVARLQQGGVEQTAIHHHIVQESPRVLYVHIHAHGDPTAIAATVREALALTGTPQPSAPTTAAVAAAFAMDTSAVAAAFAMDTSAVTAALGHRGQVNGGVWQVNVPRREEIRSTTLVVPPSMGVGTVINFQPTGDGRAAITGDYVLLGSEVNRVIRMLNEHGIAVTSLHSHMLDEEPRLFFMHFWANANAVALARGLRAALDLTNSQGPTR